MARLFDPDRVQDIIASVRSSPIAKGVFAEQLESICTLDTVVLQRLVSTQFLSIPKKQWTRAYQEFVLGFVMLSLQIHVPSWNAQVVRGAREVADKIRDRSFADMDTLNLRMACQVASGCLNEHPMIQGILVACLEMAQRQRHGVHNMKGLKVSELELSLMSEAGCMVALAGNNMQMLQLFGLGFTIPRLPLSNLHALNLPEPFLAVVDPIILQRNSKLIESIVALPSKKAVGPIGLKTLSLRSHGQSIGGCWHFCGIMLGSNVLRDNAMFSIDEDWCLLFLNLFFIHKGGDPLKSTDALSLHPLMSLNPVE